MTDAETLRAAAEVLRRRGFTATADDMEQLAQNVEAEAAAKSKAAARDRHLADVAYVTWRNLTRGDPGERDQIDVWVETIRAVREAIEAEQ